MRPSVPDVHITDPHDAELATYRALAWQAVLGLIFGLLAPLALLDPSLWAAPLFGTVVSWAALRRIKRNGSALAGRRLAMVGLTLSLLFAAAAPADWVAYRWMIRKQARQFSALWFKYLAQDEPQKAYQLTMLPPLRPPLDDRLWDFYRNSPRVREKLEDSVQAPLVRALLALGPKAQVRFYRTLSQAQGQSTDEVQQCYAVTYDDGGEKKSLLVNVKTVRQTFPDGGAGWRIYGVDIGVPPEG